MTKCRYTSDLFALSIYSIVCDFIQSVCVQRYGCQAIEMLMYLVEFLLLFESLRFNEDLERKRGVQILLFCDS